jgi:adenosylcobinamide kinase/adenosylcobinamide-phosphate guanylyltransferase
MLTLILGGARSGKSRYAQDLCKDCSNVVYVATAQAGDDPEMESRIARHRSSRPAEWKTVEEPTELSRRISEAEPDTTVLVDCITIWISNLSWDHRSLTPEARENLVLERTMEFAVATRRRNVIAVTNEVGCGIVPDSPVGREFRDLQGLANQLLAREANTVILMVAGLPLTLKDEHSSLNS